MFKSLCGVVLNPCRWTKYLCHDKFYKADSRWFCGLCHITARQYGEVVLPDDSTGQGPGTLAGKLSRCKESTAWFLPSGYKFCGLYECRGTSCLGICYLSRCSGLKESTGGSALCRACEIGARGFVKVLKSVNGVVVKAKTMTSLLIIPSVLVW